MKKHSRIKNRIVFVFLLALCSTLALSLPVAADEGLVPTTGVVLDRSELDLTEDGLAEELVATVLPEDATEQGLIWSSSNEEVAIVTNGLVTPLSAGETIINATTKDGGYTVGCVVTVSEAIEPRPKQLPMGMSPMGANEEHPLISSESMPIEVDYEVLDGYEWVYSADYSSEGYDAYIAGNSFSNRANISNIALTVSEPGLFTFDYRVSTPSSGSQYGLYYNVNERIYTVNYKDALNYPNFPDFVGVKDWTPVEITINSNDLIDGQATVYIAYVRTGTFTDNDNMVAIANACFVSGKRDVALSIDGTGYGSVTDGNNNEYSEGENVFEYYSGDTVTFTASSEAGARFYGWADEEKGFISTDETYSFVVSSDVSLKAVFAPEGYYTAQRSGEFYTENEGGLSQAWADAVEGDVLVMLQNHTLSQNKTLPEGVTLYIPYGPFFDEDGNADGNTASGSYYEASKKIAEEEKAYRTLTIEDGAELTVEGTLNIGSVIGYPSQYYQGHTSGWHGRIINDGQIVVSDEGILDCWGIITGEGTVEAETGSTVYEPFIVYDFAGGWNTAELYLNDQSPFKQYAMQNIQNKLVMNHGSTLYGRCNLWASSKYNKVDIDFIGEGAMYQLADGASITRTYDAAKYISTNEDIGKATYVFDGGMTLRYLSMPILGFAISTEEVEFPVPYNWSLVLQDGNYEYDGRIKYMPGASLKVADDAVLSVNETLFVLDGLIQSDMSGKFYPTTETLQSADFSGSGQLIVNGGMTVKEGARFGGIVQTEMDTNNAATIMIENGALVNNLDVQDGAVGEYDANTSIFDLPARAYIYDSVKEKYTLKRLYPNRTYSSYDAAGWVVDGFTMTYAQNTTREDWDGEGPFIDGKYHNWVTEIVELNEARIGSWYSEGGIYHNVTAANKTVYDDYDSLRTIINQGQLDDEMYDGGDIVFTVDTTTADGENYVYRVFYMMGSDDPVEVTPDEHGYYTISDVHDEVSIEVVSCKLGDVFQDNSIDNKDLVVLRKFLVNAESPSGFQSLTTDLYKDEVIDNKDLVQLRKMLVGL